MAKGPQYGRDEFITEVEAVIDAAIEAHDKGSLTVDLTNFSAHLWDIKDELKQRYIDAGWSKVMVSNLTGGHDRASTAWIILSDYSSCK